MSQENKRTTQDVLNDLKNSSDKLTDLLRDEQIISPSWWLSLNDRLCEITSLANELGVEPRKVTNVTGT